MKNIRFVNEQKGIMFTQKNGVDIYIDSGELYDQLKKKAKPYKKDKAEHELQENKTRFNRKKLLANSDWTQLPDARKAMGSDKAAEWDTYRQALRDITTQEGFPLEIEWPTKPE